MPISKIERAGMPGGAVLQVVQTVKTDTFSAASASFVSITGLAATITPISTTSKILISVAVAQCSINQNYSTAFRIVRDGVAIGVGNSAGSRLQSNFHGTQVGGGDHLNTYAYMYLDSPASTSTLNYQLQFATEGGSTGTINVISGGDTDSNSAKYARPSSTITLMEISA